jgi:hypothetical protein
MRREPKKPSAEKPIYKAPKLIELGALAKGEGGVNCSIGTSPTGGPCTPGNAAQGFCTLGNAASGSCTAGAAN